MLDGMDETPGGARGMHKSVWMVGEIVPKGGRGWVFWNVIHVHKYCSVVSFANHCLQLCHRTAMNQNTRISRVTCWQLHKHMFSATCWVQDMLKYHLYLWHVQLSKTNMLSVGFHFSFFWARCFIFWTIRFYPRAEVTLLFDTKQQRSCEDLVC